LLRLLVYALLMIVPVVGCQHAPHQPAIAFPPPPSPGPLPSDGAVGAIEAPAVAVVGGSYTAGTEWGGNGPDAWPALAAAQLRRQGINPIPYVAAEDGSGYTTAGNYQGRVFADQISEVVRQDDRLVIIFGSRTESDVLAEDFQPAVHQTLENVRAAARDAKVLVIGPVWTDANPPMEVLQTRDVIRGEAESTGAIFVDPIADGWFIDRPDLISSDGMHPTNSGHAYIAEKIAPLMAQQLQ
jgi:lysophospholipase L1-like esterase